VAKPSASILLKVPVRVLPAGTVVFNESLEYRRRPSFKHNFSLLSFASWSETVALCK
jgi:hypothetical protein